MRGLPEFNDELPVAVLAEEIETPGPGQIRALMTAAGNPVLSTPNGRRLEGALGQLDFMVAIDFYLNETTRFADVILPPTAHLERSHYDLFFPMLAVHNTARWVPAVFERGPDQRHDWEICAELTSRMAGPSTLAGVQRFAFRRLTPDRIIDLLLRRKRLSLRKLKASPSGVDLGPLEPRLRSLLRTKSKAVELAPKVFLDDLPRLAERLERGVDEGALVMIGRRHIRSNNSWLHNSERLTSGDPRCTLLVHPADAASRGLVDGSLATLTSAAGSIEVPVEVTDSVMPGVVCLPHGFGHHRDGIRLVGRRRPCRRQRQRRHRRALRRRPHRQCRAQRRARDRVGGGVGRLRHGLGLGPGPWPSHWVCTWGSRRCRWRSCGACGAASTTRGSTGSRCGTTSTRRPRRAGPSTTSKR